MPSAPRERRDIVKTLRVSTNEWACIQQRMALAGRNDFSDYARSVLIHEGYSQGL